MDQSIVVLSSLPEDLAFAKTIGAVCSVPVLVVKMAEDAAMMIAQGTVHTLLVDCPTEKDYQFFEKAIQERVGLFSDKINSNLIHFLSSNDIESSEFIVKSPLFGHFVLRNYGDPIVAGQLYGRMILSTHQVRAFGLQQLLGPKAKIQVVKLSHSDQKQSAVEAVRNYLIAARYQERAASTIANAVDEVLMNAIFDAPVDSGGKPFLTATPRSAPVILKDRHQVEMQIGFDGLYVGISAIDLFGSLDKVKLFSHICKVYTNKEYKIRSSTAGAGIGLATVFRTGGSFFFVSEVGIRTEVTVFFKRADNFKDFKNQFRFISTQFYSG